MSTSIIKEPSGTKMAEYTETCQNIKLMMNILQQQKKKKRNQRRKRKKHDYQLHSPGPNTCVCGAPAEMECSQFGVQGYCSDKCQLPDWEEHQLYCELYTPSKLATLTDNKYTYYSPLISNVTIYITVLK